MLEIKRGDTFSFYANISDEAGDPLVTDAANITSQIRDTMYQLVANLTVAATATPGKYLFTAATTADRRSNRMAAGNGHRPASG